LVASREFKIHDGTSKEATTSAPTSIRFLFFPPSFILSFSFPFFPSSDLYSDVKVLSGGQNEPCVWRQHLQGRGHAKELDAHV
jgi:hypothetical protein